MRRTPTPPKGVAKQSDYEKIAITLPRAVAGAAREEARARGARSLSAFITQALEEKLERDRLQEALDEVLRERPMTEAEREWADELLGL